MKNKNLGIIIGIALVVLVAIGAFIFLGKKAAPVPVEQAPTE